MKIIAINGWLAPVEIPIPIQKNKNTNSSGSFMAALNRTIDKAPTKPRDSAKENFTTVITTHVITHNGINMSEKYSLLLKDLEKFT